MNWDAISAIGEVFGACAVLVTLLYLAFQIKLARLQMVRESQTQRDAILRELMLELVRNPELRRVAAAMDEAALSAASVEELYEQANLTGSDIRLYYSWTLSFWQYRSATYEEIDSLTPRQLESFNIGLRQYGSGPARLWFQNWRLNRQDPLISYVDEQVAKVGA